MQEEVLNFDDIFDYWQPLWWQKPGVCLIVLGSVMLGIFVCARMVRWYKTWRAQQDPRSWALRRLYALNPLVGIHSREECKHFYCEMLAIIKQYLAQQHGCSTLARTDTELLDYLKKEEKRPEIALFYTAVQRLIEHGMMVKFALSQGKYEQVQADYCLVMTVFEQEKQCGVGATLKTT